MKIKIKLLLVLSLIGMGLASGQQRTVNYNTVSEEFLKALKEGKETASFEAILEEATREELEAALDTDEKKLAFWVNVYNGFIQKILRENPELYKDRRSFFSEEQIPVAGRMISFAKIEHGIIRKSQWELGLGYIRKWFPDKFERRLRVEERDYRIHFALNCGAEDCPPVAIYTPDRIDEQFHKGTKRYLERTSTYDSGKNEVAVTSLFNWFRGDFGGKSGVRQILNEQDIIPDHKVKLVYTNYNWNLKLNNYIQL
jgi:hypothetical protein